MRPISPRAYPGTMDWDNQMSLARKKLDWGADVLSCHGPGEAGATGNPPAGKEDTCSMCGNFCAVKIRNRILDGEIVSIYEE